MGYHLRIERRDKASFITARTKNSELWFANNVKVEQLALARLAQYTDKYCVHPVNVFSGGRSQEFVPYCSMACSMAIYQNEEKA